MVKKSDETHHGPMAGSKKITCHRSHGFEVRCPSGGPSNRAPPIPPTTDGKIPCGVS